MRHNPHHSVEDETTARRLIDEHPWATIVSHHDGGVVASHYPVLLDEEADALTLVTHVGRPDDEHHGLGEHELLVIVMGDHGYISPSWYAPGATPAPTWNYSAVHLYGVPELLHGEENLRVLERLVARFERRLPGGGLPLDLEVGARLEPYTVGLRIPVTRFVGKVKMSQDKDAESQRQVLAQLRGDGPYAHPRLADEMAAALRRQ